MRYPPCHRVGLFVQLNQLQQVLVTLLSSGLVALEELGGTLRELTGQTAVASLVHQELLVAASGGLGVQNKGGLAFLQVVGVEPEQVPVAAGHSLLHLILAVHHAALDGVHLTGGVANDEGGAMVSFCLGNGLDGLSGVGACLLYTSLWKVHVVEALVRVAA